MLDASILIAAERETFDLEGYLESAGDEVVAVAAITASELLHGVARAINDEVRAERHDYVEALLEDFPIVPFGPPEARIHARIWAALAATGKMIGAHDQLVAATALSLGSAVVTLNQKEFTRVPDLVVVPIARFIKRRSRPAKAPT